MLILKAKLRDRERHGGDSKCTHLFKSQMVLKGDGVRPGGCLRSWVKQTIKHGAQLNVIRDNDDFSV